MKKKVIFSLGLAIVVVGIALAILFATGVFGGTDVPETEEFDIKGSWTVAAVYNNDVPTFVDNQYMVFTDIEASIYKDDITKAFATSKYTLDMANKLSLQDISREYTVAKKSDNCVRLYDTATTYTLIIRNSVADLVSTPIEVSELEGEWDIVLKGDLLNTGEVMEFSSNSLDYYRSDSPEPITAKFVLSDNVISIEAMNMAMNCLKVDDSTIVFIEQSGIIWELSKASEK